jgi:hypothetical protein
MVLQRLPFRSGELRDDRLMLKLHKLPLKPRKSVLLHGTVYAVEDEEGYEGLVSFIFSILG